VKIFRSNRQDSRVWWAVTPHGGARLEQRESAQTSCLGDTPRARAIAGANIEQRIGANRDLGDNEPLDCVEIRSALLREP
jgi:hypothetical protein